MEVDFDIPTYGDSQMTRVIALMDPVITVLRATEHIVPMAMCHNAELHVNEDNAISTALFDEQQYQVQFAKDQTADPELARVIEVLAHRVPADRKDTGEYKQARRIAKHMALENGLLVRTVLRTLKVSGNNVLAKLNVPPQVVVPESRKAELLRMHHEDRLAGHAGMTAMLKALTGRFYWYRMARDVRAYVVNCTSCQSRKPPQPKRHGLLQLFDFSTAQPFDDVAADHYGPLPVTKNGHKYILVLMDMFTCWVEAIPVPDTTAYTMALAIYKNWISRWGVF